MGLQDWVKMWLGRGFSKSWDISYTGAEYDKCLACGAYRKYHKRKGDHRFVEKEN